MHVWKSVGTLAMVFLVAVGCSKSEVRVELVETAAMGTTSESPTGIEEHPHSGAARRIGLEEQANACRTNGGVDCERLLERRSEASASAFGPQAWAEALVTGCMLAPSKPVVDELIRLLPRAKSEGIDPRPLMTTSLEACERDVATGCLVAASAYVRQGDDIDADPPKAVVLYERACRLGTVHACSRAAYVRLEFVVDTNDVEGERQKAIELVRGPCERGDGEACAVLAEAVIYRNMPEEQRDYVEARRLAKKACDAGWPRGCNVLADLILLGSGAKDVEGGVALFTRMCERAEADEVTEYACGALAYLHAGHFELLPKSPDVARKYAKRACEVRARRVTEPCTVASEIEDMLNEAP